MQKFSSSLFKDLMPPTNKRALTASLAFEAWIGGLALKTASQAQGVFHFMGEGKVHGSVILEKTMPRSSSASTLERVAVHDGYRDRCGFKTGRMCEVALPEWAESAHRIERACEGFFGTFRGGGAFEEKQGGFAPAFRNIQRTIEPDRLAKTCSEMWFFVSTFWARASAGKASGGLQSRLVKTPLFPAICLADLIEIWLANPQEWISIASFGAWKDSVEWDFVRARCAARGGDLICPHTLSRL